MKKGCHVIRYENAIRATWMVLEGLGYRKEDNPELEKTVRDTFSSSPTILIEWGEQNG